MEKINSKILHEVHTKYQVKFPNLANSEDLLTKTYDQFKNRKKPEDIVDKKHSKDPKDYQCKSIQKAFKLKTIKNLTSYDCWMMLVDGPVINDDAYLYFLPRLLKHVLEDPVHEDLLSSRLKSLDERNLSPDETAIIEKIIIVADEIEGYWDMHEAKDV
jgi:hypothetical protein